MSILEFYNKECVSEVPNELLKTGSQKLISAALGAELRKLNGFDGLAKQIERMQFSDGIDFNHEIRISTCILTQTTLLAITPDT